MSFSSCWNLESILKTTSHLVLRLHHVGVSSGYFLLANYGKAVNREEAAIFLMPINYPEDGKTELVRSVWRTAGILMFNNYADEVVLTGREEAGGLRVGDYILVVKGFSPEENEAIVLILADDYGYLSHDKTLALAKERKNKIFQNLVCPWLKS